MVFSSDNNNNNNFRKAVTVVSVSSSGSEGGGDGGRRGGDDHEKKRRRMESNRESARRSRQRKQQHMDELIKQVASLTRENEGFGKKIDEFSGAFAAMAAQNGVLTKEKDRLAARLESLESVIEIAKVVKGGSGSNNNGGGECLYEVSDDPMMKPWQLPHPSLAIMASSALRCFNSNAYN